MHKPLADGQSLLVHLQKVKKQTGRTPIELVREPLPPGVVHVWNWWCELHLARKPGEPVAYGDIIAWAYLMRVRIRPWEVKAIYKLERVYFKGLA